MIEIRYKRILFAQAIFLIALAFFSYFFLESNSRLYHFFLLWFVAITLNLLFLKKYALPTKGLLQKVGPSATEESLSWAEIEESLTQKDVAFIKQKEELEHENLKYKRLLDSLDDPVCILNQELIIIYANDAFTELFHYKEKTLPVPLIEISRNLDFQEFLENAIEFDSTSRRSYFSFNPIQDPHKSYFDLKVFPVDDTQNYLCLMHDVSERKLADQMRDDFISNFSHEVRTPLTILNGHMQSLKSILANDPLYEDRFAGHFAKIENNSRRLINLFNDLLRLSSIETKKDLQKEEIDIEEMLTFLTGDLLLNYPNKDVVFDIQLDHKIFFVDYHLFEQVLINLIDNSLKYIEHKGLISIRSFSEEQWSTLIVSDNGIGIPDEQVHRIFERFFRVDSSRSSEIKGTGLGLSIVKRIVQRHEGRIKVQSNSQTGTSFIVSFPKA